MTKRTLTLDDIADQRAYARERDEFRDRIMALKRRRRVHLGDFVTVVFENVDTMRWQIQEMARVEKLVTDEAIQAELDTYNALIPQPGELSATLLIELTDKPSLQEWLPKLVGIERSVVLYIGDDRIVAVPDEEQDERLTREEVTAAVHFVKFGLSDDQVAAFERGPVRLHIDHEHYRAVEDLSEETRAELLRDLRG